MLQPTVADPARHRIAWVLAGALTLGAACASAPRFAPSSPIEESWSLHEGLLLCDEYDPPRPMERPIALKPFVDCVDELADRHGEQGSAAFSLLRRELQSQYDTFHDSMWSPAMGSEVAVATHAALRAVWREGLDDRARPPGLLYTPQEQELVLRHYPRTAAAVGASAWKVSSAAAFDPKLERLRAGLTSLSGSALEASARSGGPSEARLGTRLCQEYLDLRSEAAYLSSLLRDYRDMTRLAPEDDGAERVRRRYVEGLGRAVAALRQLEPRVRAARAEGYLRLQACAAEPRGG
jgi:hypothetical protein